MKIRHHKIVPYCKIYSKVINFSQTKSNPIGHPSSIDIMVIIFLILIISIDWEFGMISIVNQYECIYFTYLKIILTDMNQSHLSLICLNWIQCLISNGQIITLIDKTRSRLTPTRTSTNIELVPTRSLKQSIPNKPIDM